MKPTSKLASEQPAPMSPIQGALGGLSEAISEAENSIYVLRDRLNRALQPAAPEAIAKGTNLSVASEVKSDLTQEIDAHRRRIDAARMVLDDLLNRLEV